jgi:hypothetical protein
MLLQEKGEPGPLVETLRRAKSAFFEAMQRGFTVGVPELLNRHLLTADALAAGISGLKLLVQQSCNRAATETWLHCRCTRAFE